MGGFGSRTMKSPFIGRSIAVALIVGVLGWNVVRALGSRSPETPKLPFPAPASDAPLASAKGQQTAVLAGGCFWGIQAVFEHLKGVTKAASGYAGGHVKSPSYESVSMGVTGHAESVSITFDPSQITYGQILMVYFSVAHDPTQWNRQGPDTGSKPPSLFFFPREKKKKRGRPKPARPAPANFFPPPLGRRVDHFQAFS